MKTLVLGIGNTLIGDDGIGIYVARELAEKIDDENIDVMETAIDGLNLLDHLRHYERLIVIDAILDDKADLGTIFRLTLGEVPPPSRAGAASHNLNLATTLNIGDKVFPGEIPGEVTIFAVVAQNVDYVVEEMTAEVQQSVPRVVDLVLNELGLTADTRSAAIQ